MEQFECIDLDVVNDVNVVKFKDQKVMDPARIEILGRELLALVEEDKNENVVINFENVSFFSSAAINKLIVLERRVSATGGKICLSNLRPEVRDLFSYTNLDQVFQIKDGQSDAIETLAKD